VARTAWKGVYRVQQAHVRHSKFSKALQRGHRLDFRPSLGKAHRASIAAASSGAVAILSQQACADWRPAISRFLRHEIP
jgi:hypothetical protein